MQIVRFAQREFVPAGHENPLAPGVWKKVLLHRSDLQEGHAQMVNWARLPVGQAFAPHYHEDLQEVFVIVRGEAELTVDAVVTVLGSGDVVVIDPREIHAMRNRGDEDVEYVVLGIAGGVGGRTVLVPAGGR